MAVYASRAEETNRKRDNRRKTSKLQIFRPYRHRQGRRRKFFARITIGKDGDANPSPVSSSARPMTQILRPYPRRQGRRRKSFARVVVGKAGVTNPSPASYEEERGKAGAPSSSRHCRHHTGTLPAAQSTQTSSSTRRSVAARPKPPAEASANRASINQLLFNNWRTAEFSYIRPYYPDSTMKLSRVKSG